MSNDTKFLTGVKVVEMGMYISAPSASRALADFGAEVIKIENPNSGGDPSRWMLGGEFDWSPQFASWNRGKKSAGLNIKSDAGGRALHALIATADVLIDNVRPGVLARLGLGEAELKALNPKLVHCTITGFGPDGPLAEQPGYDSVISGRSGLFSEMTPEGGTPAGPLFSDLLTGMRAVQLISAALVRQARTGEGCRIDVPMLGAVTDFMGEAVAMVEAGTHTANPHARQSRIGMLACGTKDGRIVIMNIGERQEAFALLKTIVQAGDALDGAEFATFNDRVDNHAMLNREVNALTSTMNSDALLADCAKHQLPASPMVTLPDALKDPQSRHLGLVEEYPVPGGSTLRLASPGYRIDGKAGRGTGLPPSVGGDTRSVLEGVGLSEEDIQDIEKNLVDSNLEARVTARVARR